MVESTQKNLSQVLSHITLQDAFIFLLATIALITITQSIENFSRSMEKKYPNERMRIFEWIPLINFGIYFGGFLAIILIIFQPTKEYFLGFLASMLIAISFATKDIIQSIIAGMVLLIDKPFQVGDRITTSTGYHGEILHIGLRSVKLVSNTGSIITIPNSSFMYNAVASNNAGEIGMVVTVEIYTSVKNDIFAITKILEDTARQSPYVDKEVPISTFTTELLSGTSSMLEIQTRCGIKDARAEKVFKSQFLMNANKALMQAGVR